MEPNAAQTRTLRQMEKHKVKLWAPDKKKHQCPLTKELRKWRLWGIKVIAEIALLQKYDLNTWLSYLHLQNNVSEQ